MQRRKNGWNDYIERYDPSFLPVEPRDERDLRRLRVPVLACAHQFAVQNCARTQFSNAEFQSFIGA
jgi:hypothetical protein